MNPFFSYLGVLSQKMHFLKYFWLFDTFFLTPTLSCDNTPNRFFTFKKSIFINIWEINYFFDFLDVFTPSLQVWWIFVENWWRNNLSKLTTFNPVFQLPHSALEVFRVIWSHAVTFWAILVILSHSRPFWCCFGSFWGPRGYLNGPRVLQHDI